ncbi:ABC transporter family protein, partial [Vibrio parahaemolyticus V-223/04]
YLTSMA